MTTQSIHAKVNDYAAETDFDRGDLNDDREHMAPAAFVALRYVLHACDELDRSDLMAAAVHRIRTAISTAFDHVPTHVTGHVTGTVIQAGNIDGGVRL
jgi:hypothetical protein